MLANLRFYVFNNSNIRDQLARILIDGGSQRSFIHPDLAQKLNLKTLRKEKLFVYSFGYYQGRTVEYDVVEFTFKSIHCSDDTNSKSSCY